MAAKRKAAQEPQDYMDSDSDASYDYREELHQICSDEGLYRLERLEQTLFGKNPEITGDGKDTTPLKNLCPKVRMFICYAVALSHLPDDVPLPHMLEDAEAEAGLGTRSIEKEDAKEDDLE